ncbi:MAG: MATE family efflux transporter [Lachnospiraceae bacterium]|nr:MATE family efflux transporter [Lachnospiraceae bacterium]MDY5741399.1 MATE family efflux transporter [Lachnospiraceae bacterium]
MNDKLLKGSITRNLLLFSLPIFAGAVFQQLYNLVDSVIVGRFVGMRALAAVGSTGPLTFFVLGMMMGLTSGFGIMIAQAFGAGDQERLRRYVGQAMTLSLMISVLMTIILLLTNHQVLALMRTNPEIYRDTDTYIRIIYAGLISAFFYNLFSCILRALGDSRTPLYFLVLSSALNIVLDIVLVAGLGRGVAGAGYATVISQVVSGAACYIYMLKKYPILRLRREYYRLEWGAVKLLLGTGIPMGLQFSITAIGTMMIQAALNGLSAAHIAGYAAAMKIQNITMQTYVSIGVALATFTGQNIGAGNTSRICRGVRVGAMLCAISAVICACFSYILSDQLILLFLKEYDASVLEAAKTYFGIAIWFYLPLGQIFVYRNVLQGIGESVAAMFGGLLELIARAAAILFAAPLWGYPGIVAADPAAWIAALLILIPYYYYYRRRWRYRSSPQ